MYPTRRLWAAIALAAFLASLAVVTARPLLLAGSGLVGAWVLARQYRFLRTLEETVDDLTVQQAVGRSGVRTDDRVPVTLSASLERETPLALAIDAGLPTAAASESTLSVSLEPGETDGERTVEVSWPIAGRHRFDEATVRVSDGYLRETLSAGDAPTVTVEPPEPRRIHVGEGGDRIASAYGEHEGDGHGSGVEPAELREYVAGDTADQIDWKATARLGSPHVREYEASTDRRTLLVVDHRAALATGRRGETKLEYLRDVALAMAGSARRLGDPTGLLTVGDEGITTRIDPETTPATYTRIRRHLLDLRPTRDPSSTAASRTTGTQTAADARAKHAAISGESDAFAATLRPFYATREGYRERIESDPLYRALETALGRGRGSTWTVVFTDDSRPAELRETVKLARRTGNAVMVLLAPTVLYESDGLADLERAYDRYAEFEELRRDLGRMARVTALEVGPRDRLSTVLSAARPRARGETP